MMSLILYIIRDILMLTLSANSFSNSSDTSLVRSQLRSVGTGFRLRLCFCHQSPYRKPCKSGTRDWRVCNRGCAGLPTAGWFLLIWLNDPRSGCWSAPILFTAIHYLFTIIILTCNITLKALDYFARASYCVVILSSLDFYLQKRGKLQKVNGDIDPCRLNDRFLIANSRFY